MIRRPPRSTLSLHDALPILPRQGESAVVHGGEGEDGEQQGREKGHEVLHDGSFRVSGESGSGPGRASRSEEHTSELQSRLHLVCRLLLEKKKQKNTSTGTQS